MVPGVVGGEAGRIIHTLRRNGGGGNTFVYNEVLTSIVFMNSKEVLKWVNKYKSIYKDDDIWINLISCDICHNSKY